jgi:hypothetical protein
VLSGMIRRVNEGMPGPDVYGDIARCTGLTLARVRQILGP